MSKGARGSTPQYFHKQQYTDINQSAGASQVLTGPWHDTTLTGGIFVSCTVVFAGGGNLVNFIIQSSEDQNTILNIQSTTNSTSPIRIMGLARSRYWRITLTAPVGGSSSVVAITTECSLPIANTQGFGNITDAVQIFANGTSAIGSNDGISSASMAPIFNAAGSATLQEQLVWEFNGTTLDRIRNNVFVQTGDTGAKTATFNGATQTNFASVGAWITCLVSAVSGTTPTLVLQLQWSPDGGTTWLNLGPATTALTAAGQVLIAIGPTNWSQAAGVTPANLVVGATQSVFINAFLPRTWRIVYTIGGTTPSFTITQTEVQYQKG